MGQFRVRRHSVSEGHVVDHVNRMTCVMPRGRIELSTAASLPGRHEPLQLLEPVLHDDDLARGGCVSHRWLEHQEPLAVAPCPVARLSLTGCF